MYNCMACPYEEGARGPFAFDCLGIVRELFHESTGKPKDLIPEWGGVTRENGMHDAFIESKGDWLQVDAPESNCLVCAMNDEDELAHIGIYIDGQVYHSSRGMGPSSVKLHSFGHFGRLEYYVHR